MNFVEQSVSYEVKPQSMGEPIRLVRSTTKRSPQQELEDQKAQDRRALERRRFEMVIAMYADAQTRNPVVAQQYAASHRSTKRTTDFTHYAIDVERLTREALGGSAHLWNKWCDIVAGVPVDPRIEWRIVRKCSEVYAAVLLPYIYFRN